MIVNTNITQKAICMRIGTKSYKLDDSMLFFYWFNLGLICSAAQRYFLFRKGGVEIWNKLGCLKVKNQLKMSEMNIFAKCS